MDHLEVRAWRGEIGLISTAVCVWSSVVRRSSSDGGLLVMRELDDVLGLSDLASEALRDNRTGKNTLHRLDGLFRQSVFGRLAGYEDVNDADRLALDPVMRQVVGGRAVEAQAASASQMGRFETETLALAANRAALADLNGQWIDRFP